MDVNAVSVGGLDIVVFSGLIVLVGAWEVLFSCGWLIVEDARRCLLRRGRCRCCLCSVGEEVPALHGSYVVFSSCDFHLLCGSCEVPL